MAARGSRKAGRAKAKAARVKSRGVPLKRTPAMVAKIIERISVYEGPVRTFFQQPGNEDLCGFPTHARWMDDDAAYRKQFTHAREENLEFLQRETFRELREVEIRDTPRFNKDGDFLGNEPDTALYQAEVRHREAVNKQAIKTAGQMMPRKYKSVPVEHSLEGGIGDLLAQGIARARKKRKES